MKKEYCTGDRNVRLIIIVAMLFEGKKVKYDAACQECERYLLKPMQKRTFRDYIDDCAAAFGDNLVFRYDKHNPVMWLNRKYLNDIKKGVLKND